MKFWTEISSYGGLNEQNLLFVCAFLGVLLLIISGAIPVPESCDFSAFYFSIQFFFPLDDLVA